MWSLFIFEFLCIIYFSFAFLEILSNSNGDVLWNSVPPTVIKEMEQNIKFFNDETLKLECNIDGTPRPSYQWYRSTSDITDVSNIQDILFEKVSSGNAYILEINGTMSNKKFDKYLYYCVAQNPLGILHSSKVIVEKVSRPSIQVNYKLHNVYEGEKYVIQCNTEPGLWTGLFKFKWWEVRLKPDNILYLNKTEGRYSVITCTKIPQLHIRNITKTDFDKTKFRCIFESAVVKDYNIYGKNNNFFKSLEKISYEAPSYLSNKCWDGETINAIAESNVELPWCSVPKTLDVTWFKIDKFDKHIEIGTKPNDLKYQMISSRYGNLLITNLTKQDSGKYMAMTGKAKQIQLTYVLNVYESASISLSPLNIQKELSESAEFVCTATYSKCQFHWLHNGQKVTSDYDDGNVRIISSNNQSTVTILKTRLSVFGIYQCVATSDNEYRQLSASLLISKVPPMLYRQSPRVERDTSTAQIQMSTNTQATIECVFSANPKPNIDWYRDAEKVPIVPWFNFNIQSDTKSIYNFITKLTIDLTKMPNNQYIRPYAGEYQAVATNSLGSASCKTFVLMDGPLELRLPEKQIAVGGRDFLLSCYFASMGVPEFSWSRTLESGHSETMPSNHRTVMRERNYKLLLKNVVKGEDEGTYHCSAKYNQITVTGKTKIEVANPPNLQPIPSKQDISDVNYHICTVNNKADKPWFVWWTFTKYNSNETTIIRPQNSDSSDYSVQYDSNSPGSRHEIIDGVPSFLEMYSNKGVNLNIRERSYDRSALGRFTCHAKNHIGSTEISIEDNFLSLEFQIVPPSTSEVVVGDDLYLNCTAKESDLEPYTKWRISLPGDKYIDINDLKDVYGGRIYQQNNGTLIIKNIRESDPSTMYCFIIPSKKNIELQSKVAYIDIRVPAKVQPMAKEIFKVAGTSFNISCNIYGHTQSLEVTWFYRVNNIGQWQSLYKTCIYSPASNCVNPYQSNSGKFNPITQSYNSTNQSVIFEFKDVTEDTAGFYKCEAKNKFNTRISESSTQLTIISKPGKVTIDDDRKSSTATEIQIQWTPPTLDGHRAILGYVIKYSERHLNKEKKNVTEISIRVNKTVLSIKLENLRPYRMYDVTIAAVNEVGIGESSETSIMTQEAKPERPVKNLKASSTQPDAILITWDNPEQQYQNGRITQYSVCYQKMPSVEGAENTHVSQLSWPNNFDELNNNARCDTVREQSYSVSSLPQFTDFGIKVVAFTSVGASPAAYTKVRTLEDLPQAPPTDLSCKAAQQTIFLEWNPPGRQTINGVLTGYVVNYYKPNKYGDEYGMLSVNVQGTTHVMLDNLEPSTAYSIYIMAANRKGLGPQSIPVICNTKEAKPEAPAQVKTTRVNSTCVIVSWLHTEKPHGKITSYCVSGFPLPHESPKCQPPDFSKRYNYMTLCSNHQEVYSKIKVYARNSYDGASKDSSPIKDDNGIISFGGLIRVSEGSAILLPCETSKGDSQNVVWKKDTEIIDKENPNLVFHKNNSLEIKSYLKDENYVYMCAIDYDSIEYNFYVTDSHGGSLKPPYLNDPRVTENSIFISWKSRGTTYAPAPITKFVLTWTNLYTGESKTVSVEGGVRNHYLKNVTCASEFHIQIKSGNAEGFSEFSEVKKIKTLGSAPQIADSNILLPSTNIGSNSAYFNLIAFGPGDNCSATSFQIKICHASIGLNDYDYVYNKTIGINDLENKCCYKVTQLNPMTPYTYKVTAYNPAGSTNSYSSFTTLSTNEGFTMTSHSSNSRNSGNSNPWIIMVILVVAVIIIMVILIFGVLYVVRHREKRVQNNGETYQVRKIEYNPPRKERQLDDTTSMDSTGEPSPYAVYQPENDQKPYTIWNSQAPPTSSTPGYNYPEHQYNHIKYEKILQNSNLDYKRRVNSAECLSSCGNASISGIADLESPLNIIPTDYINNGRNRLSTNDDVFHNLPIGGNCLTIYRPNKRVRRDSDIIRYPGDERKNLVNPEFKGMMNPRNDPTNFKSQHSYYGQQGNQNIRRPFHQQMSVPEPSCVQTYGYSGNLRFQPGLGTSQPKHPSTSQTINYGNYYETNSSQSVYPNVKRGNSNYNNNPQIEPYSKYVPNHLSNYASQQRTSTDRQEYIAPNGTIPNSNRSESSGDGIYTDKVVVV